MRVSAWKAQGKHILCGLKETQNYENSILLLPATSRPSATATQSWGGTEGVQVRPGRSPPGTGLHHTDTFTSSLVRDLAHLSPIEVLGMEIFSPPW